MKKFWSLMLVALVTLGAAACTENDENVDAKQEAGLSFYAEIANDTRAYIDDADGDKIWETIWESGDILEVSTDGTKMFNFTYDGEKFTCNEPGVTELLGQTVTIISRYQDRNSYAGKSGWGINVTQVENFASGSTVTFEAFTSFFRYTYNGDGDITITVTADGGDSRPYVFQDGNLNFFEDITISDVKGENFIPFWTQNAEPVSATLSYSIDGVKCKETVLNLQPGKVYNLGTLTDPVASAYSVVGTNNNWTAGETPMYVVGDYYVAYGVEFAEDGMFKVLGNDIWLGADSFSLGVWTAVNTSGGDISIVAGTYDFYFSEADSKICVVEAGAECPVFSIGVVGLGDNWDTDIDMTLEGDYYTLKSVTITATDTFKLRVCDSWNENYGISSSDEVEPIAINVDAMYKLVQDGKNMQVAAGTYDLYFNYITKMFYVLTEGTTPDSLAIPQYKVYVYNFETDWSNFYLYTWDADGNYPLGAWPGSTKTEVVTINGYEYMSWTLPKSATGKAVQAIITNNTGAQTADYDLGTINEDKYILLNNGIAQPIEDINNPEPEIPTETYKVYVYKYNNTWSTLNLYTWDNATSATYTGSWPGTTTSTTEVINGYTYYVWEMPAAAVGRQFKAILNNGSAQTGDSDAYTLNKDIYIRLNGTAIQDITDPNNPEPSQDSVARKIYATTTLSWSNMNIYAWGGGSSFGWPGTAMSTETINGTKYYVYTFDKSMDGSTLSGVIFNDGSAQTIDITNVKLDKDRFFRVLTTKSGNNYNYEEIEDPR